MEKNKKIPDMYKKVYPLLLFIATLFMSVGYAAVNSVSSEIVLNATAEANNGVFISSVIHVDNQRAILENCKVNSALKTMLSTSIELSNTDPNGDPNAYYTYAVDIINNSNDKYMYTGVVHDEVFYTDANGVYNEDIIYEVTGINKNTILNANDKITVQIKFKYKNSNITQNVLNSYVNFIFEKIHSVTYINGGDNYPLYVIDGENLVVDMSNKNYTDLTITIDGINTNSYTYENKILTIPNVTGDVIIEAYTDTPSSAIPTEKDFETIITFQGDQNYFMISLTNTTDQDATGWAVYIEVPSDTTVATFYNCKVEKVNNVLIITNESFNGSIAAGQTGYYLAGITIKTSDTSYTPTNYTAIIKNN